MAHTPGSWIAQRDDGTITQPYTIYSPTVSTWDGKQYVSHPVALYVREEDKDLLAAAPDMLKALKAVEWIDLKYGHTLYCPWCNNFADEGHKPDCLRTQALAKAEQQP